MARSNGGLPWRPVLLVVLLVGLAWGGWRLRDLLTRPPAVEVATVERGDVTRVLAVTGRVRPRFTNTVRPVVSGRLVELAFEEGEEVRQGAVMARLDAGVERSGVSRAEAAVAEQTVVVEQARRDLERSRRLFDDGVVPESRYDTDLLALRRAEERLAELREAVATERARLDDFELRAPISGWVLRRPVDPGQTVSADTVLYEISTNDEPMVEAAVDELYLTELREGQPARVAPLRDTGEVWPATVSYVGRQVDPSTGAGTVRLTFAEDVRERVGELPVGLSLDVNIEVARHPDALTVPRTAVLGLGSTPRVLVVVEGSEGADGGDDGAGDTGAAPGDGADGPEAVARTASRSVVVIDWPAPRLVVLDGLEEGERVLTEPRGVSADVEVRPVAADAGAGGDGGGAAGGSGDGVGMPGTAGPPA